MYQKGILPYSNKFTKEEIIEKLWPDLVREEGEVGCLHAVAARWSLHLRSFLVYLIAWKRVTRPLLLLLRKPLSDKLKLLCRKKKPFELWE